MATERLAGAIGSIVVFMLLSGAVPAVAQVPTIPGGRLDVVEIIQNAVAAGSDLLVYTVPSNKRLVITDVILSANASGPTCGNTLLRAGTRAMSELCFSNVAFGTLAFSFITGIEFGPGDTVAVRNATTVVNWYLRGYLTRP